MVIAGFATPSKRRGITTVGKKKNMNWDSVYYILFDTKQKYCDMLESYATSEKLEYKNKSKT